MKNEHLDKLIKDLMGKPIPIYNLKATFEKLFPLSKMEIRDDYIKCDKYIFKYITLGGLIKKEGYIGKTAIEIVEIKKSS